MKLLETRVEPDFEAMIRCVLRKEDPKRVYHIELYLDQEIINAVSERFDLAKNLHPSDPLYSIKRDVAVHRFLGYDVFRITLPGLDFPLHWHPVGDPANPQGQVRDSRDWVEEHKGPIQTWDDFENYPWPEVKNVDTSVIEWCEKNLPDGMAVFDLTTHIFENLSWSLGYETLCYKLYDDPDLVQALAKRIGEIYLDFTRLLCQFSRIGAIWGSDDMGFKTQTLIPPDALRRLILPWHKRAVAIAREYGKPYFLHACGNIEPVMEDLIEDVCIDARHSFEDEIIPVTEAKKKYSGRVGILGGIDMDFLSRANEADIRRRVRETLDVCQPGGGYCLGTGNTVANYIPLENYLIMLDEGRRYGQI